MMTREGKTVLWLVIPLVAAAIPAPGLGPDSDQLTWYTIDGGGVMFSTGGEYELSGTIGQPNAGVLANGDYELTGGFWFPQVPGDCDTDGGVNLFDYEVFTICHGGPDTRLVNPDCGCFDLDNDNDVDLVDVAMLWSAYTGPS